MHLLCFHKMKASIAMECVHMKETRNRLRAYGDWIVCKIAYVWSNLNMMDRGHDGFLGRRLHLHLASNYSSVQPCNPGYQKLRRRRPTDYQEQRPRHYRDQVLFKGNCQRLLPLRQKSAFPLLLLLGLMPLAALRSFGGVDPFHLSPPCCLTKILTFHPASGQTTHPWCFAWLIQFLHTKRPPILQWQADLTRFIN